MKSFNTQNPSEDECIINSIPQSINISSRSLTYNYIQKNESNNNSNKKNAKLLNKILFLKKYSQKIKSADGSTTTAINSNTEKIKEVTFSTVEIIRIQSVKQFNKLNSYTNTEIKNNKIDAKKEKDKCNIF